MFQARWRRLCCLMAVATLVGCTSKDAAHPKRVPVTGKVIYQGQPVEGAHVTFAPQAQGLNPAFGTTDASGVFKLSTFDADDGAQPGEYAVTISKTIIEGAQKAEAPIQNTGTPPPPPKTTEMLPVKYKSATDSGLTATVEEKAANEFSFELK
ncbi:MAG: carboxypeptidase-like regulatory domain-containing protein [Thermoguttaceae bacterium]